MPHSYSRTLVMRTCTCRARAVQERAKCSLADLTKSYPSQPVVLLSARLLLSHREHQLCSVSSIHLTRCLRTLRARRALVRVTPYKLCDRSEQADNRLDKQATHSMSTIF